MVRFCDLHEFTDISPPLDLTTGRKTLFWNASIFPQRKKNVCVSVKQFPSRRRKEFVFHVCCIDVVPESWFVYVSLTMTWMCVFDTCSAVLQYKKFSLTEFEYGRRKKCLKISVFPTQTCSPRCWLLLGVFKEKRKRNKKYGQSISIMCVIFGKSIDHFTRFENHLNKHYSDVQWREMFDSIIANIAGGCIFRRAEQQLRNTLGRTTRSTTTVSFVSDAFVTANTMKYIYWLFYDPDTRFKRDFSTFYPHSVVRYDVSDEKLINCPIKMLRH